MSVNPKLGKPVIKNTLHGGLDRGPTNSRSTCLILQIVVVWNWMVFVAQQDWPRGIQHLAAGEKSHTFKGEWVRPLQISQHLFQQL